MTTTLRTLVVSVALVAALAPAAQADPWFHDAGPGEEGVIQADRPARDVEQIQRMPAPAGARNDSMVARYGWGAAATAAKDHSNELVAQYGWGAAATYAKLHGVIQADRPRRDVEQIQRMPAPIMLARDEPVDHFDWADALAGAAAALGGVAVLAALVAVGGRMRRLWVTTCLAAFLTASATMGASALPTPTARHGDERVSSAALAEARGVASDLFRSVNERRYGLTCDLLVTRPRRDLCVAGLRSGLMGWHEVAFRITGVTFAGGRAVVHALADGVPGRVVLVRQAGRLRVLRLEGS